MKKDNEGDRLGDEGLREVGWREASGRRKERKKDRQRKDPKTFQANSQGRDPSTPERNSQGRDPRTFKEPVEMCRVQKNDRKEAGRKRKRR